MPSASTRLNRLLRRGFYPAELPPTFRTKRFNGRSFSFTSSPNHSGSTLFFDGATYRGTLRTFGVINPINYFLLSKFIADNWSDISRMYRMSMSSGEKPTFSSNPSGERGIDRQTLTFKRKRQHHMASNFPIVLSLDINRFYGSIYTHSIPWAILGKREAKRRLARGTLKKHWSDKLDTLVRNCNQRQTVGVPIGPDTSRIISEILLSRIDADLTSSPTNISHSRVFHNIDDYQIGAFDQSEVESAQSQFVRTISRYELRLNDSKTSVDHGMEFAPANFQVHFDALEGKDGKKFVEHLFEILYSQIPLHPDLNVLGYALKAFALDLASNRETSLVREYLQRLIFATPHQVRWILPLLLGIYRKQGVDRDVARLLYWGIETCSRRNDIGSLLWFMYGSIFLNVKLSRSICNQCFGMSNGLVDVMLCHGKHLGLFSFPIGEMRNRYGTTDFDSEGWLPLYEVERNKWDNSAAFKKCGTQYDPGNFYNILRNQNVEFYLSTKNVFQVEAFEGWNLKQSYFEQPRPRGRRRRVFVGLEYDQ